MRSRRHGLAQMTAMKASTSAAVIEANSRPLTPPRNRIAMLMETTTPNAPRSGCSSSSTPTTAITPAIGAKPLRKSCMKSCLRTVKSAA